MLTRSPINKFASLANLAILLPYPIFPLNQNTLTSATPTFNIKLSDFDFTVTRTRLASLEQHDGSVTIRMPGKDRKTANHELQLIPYFKKHKLSFKKVAIGKNRKKTHSPIVVFDQELLDPENAVIRNQGQAGGLVNSKGHALKILEIFNVPFPKKAGQIVKLYFTLHPIADEKNNLNYKICTISLMKIIADTDASGNPRVIKKRRFKKLRTLPPPIVTPQEQSNEPNIL